MTIEQVLACSHAGLLVTREEQAPKGQANAVRAAFETIGEDLRTRRPDALAIIATDHGRAYTWRHVPQVVVGVSDTAQGLGDAGVPEVTVPIHQGVARHTLFSLIGSGVDASYSEAMQIDHSFVMPMYWAIPEFDIPIVPIAINTGAPPFMTFRRARQIGAALREALETLNGLRVAVLATGGLSHWVGTPEWREFLTSPPGTRLPQSAQISLEIEDTGPINEMFDRDFLGTLVSGTLDDFLRRWPEDRVATEAGNGANEIRNWIIAAETVMERKAEILCYEPVSEWLTGTAIVHFPKQKTLSQAALA